MDYDHLPAEPLVLFADWMKEAEASEPSDANAMSVATATGDGIPSVRIVLLKEFDARGFAFYTNTKSRKGSEIAQNPHACLNFHWKTLRRQVRINGTVECVSEAEADSYFASRPRASQIGAWASDQSRPLDARRTLEQRVADFEAKYANSDVPRPAHWSGYRVVPVRIEFWVDRRDRLHERYIYDRSGPTWSLSMQHP
jgi:pyridoxamine 5'-phosphate oxidase